MQDTSLTWTHSDGRKLCLPEHILITQGYGRKFDGFVVIDFDVNGDRPIQEMYHTSNHLMNEQTHSTTHDKYPNYSAKINIENNLLLLI